MSAFGCGVLTERHGYGVSPSPYSKREVQVWLGREVSNLESKPERRDSEMCPTAHGVASTEA
jgi:hypothetical protein